MIDKERLQKILNTNHKCFGTENLILNSKLVKELNLIIKKLNDQVDQLVTSNDALTKQKEYLQSKLREKEITKIAKTTDGREMI
jgi:hypothetical protein|tara:strand:- start:211 stop:462 length:252 start_codon:yes stop_codon:yes gene_type:complete